MANVMLAEYGRAKTINFDLYEVDGVDFRVDAADAGADCSIDIDGAGEGTCANDFVDEGQGYSLVLTAAELVGARIMVYIVDTAAKVWLDKAIVIETYGHPSSAHPNLSPAYTNGAVNGGTPTTTAFIGDGFTEATADHFNGSRIMFTSGANAGQSRTIVDYAVTTQLITIGEPLLAAPADDDEFQIFAGAEFGGGDVAKVMRLLLTILDQSTGQIDSGSFVAGAINAAAIAANAITSSEFAQSAADKVWDTVARILTAATNFNDLSAADVSSEMEDSLVTDARTATAQAAPSTTPTIVAALMTVYDALVHGVDVTATLKTFKNNAGTVIWKKALSDDGTTYAEDESASGPA